MGILITRGATLQNELHAAVRRFADERSIGGFEDLAANGYVPTPKQKAAINRRVTRSVNPLPFADAWTDNFVGNKYGQATTHWDKLMARVQRGVGNPCPLLLIGLPASIIHFDRASVDAMEDDEASDPGSS